MANEDAEQDSKVQIQDLQENASMNIDVTSDQHKDGIYNPVRNSLLKPNLFSENTSVNSTMNKIRRSKIDRQNEIKDKVAEKINHSFRKSVVVPLLPMADLKPQLAQIRSPIVEAKTR